MLMLSGFTRMGNNQQYLATPSCMASEAAQIPYERTPKNFDPSKNASAYNSGGLGNDF